MSIDENFLEKVRLNDPDTKKLVVRPEAGITLSDIDQLIAAGKKNTFLEILVLSEQSIDDEMASKLSELRGVKELVLDCNDISDNGAKSLSGMRHLERLHLGWNYITDAGAVSLAESKSLTFLKLTGNQVTSGIKKSFLENKKLTELGLSQTDIDEPTLSEIKQHIKSNFVAATSVKVEGEPLKELNPVDVKYRATLQKK